MEIDAFRGFTQLGVRGTFPTCWEAAGRGRRGGAWAARPSLQDSKGTDVDKKEKARKACRQPQGRGRECREAASLESEWKERLPLGLTVGSWRRSSASPAARGHLDGPLGFEAAHLWSCLGLAMPQRQCWHARVSPAPDIGWAQLPSFPLLSRTHALGQSLLRLDKGTAAPAGAAGLGWGRELQQSLLDTGGPTLSSSPGSPK